MRQAGCGRRTGIGKWKGKCQLTEIGIDERKILIFFIFIGVLVFVFEKLIKKKESLPNYY